MKDFVEFLFKSIVKQPEAVSVEETKEASNIRYVVTVDPTDMGLVIGKEGRTINAIRSLVKARAVKESVWVEVDLADSGRAPEVHTEPDHA